MAKVGEREKSTLPLSASTFANISKHSLETLLSLVDMEVRMRKILVRPLLKPWLGVRVCHLL